MPLAHAFVQPVYAERNANDDGGENAAKEPFNIHSPVLILSGADSWSAGFCFLGSGLLCRCHLSLLLFGDEYGGGEALLQLFILRAQGIEFSL